MFEIPLHDWYLTNMVSIIIISLQISTFTPQTKKTERLCQWDGGPPKGKRQLEHSVTVLHHRYKKQCMYLVLFISNQGSDAFWENYIKQRTTNG